MEENNIRFALIDDDKETIDVIGASIESVLKSKNCDCIYQKYNSPKTFLSNLNTYPLDLIFCDIEMPELDGIEMVGRIPEERRPDVIFVSNREDRVFDALCLHPFGFIRKKRFLEDINKVISTYLEQRKNKRINKLVIKSVETGETEKISLDIDDIVYVESDLKKQNIHIANVDRPISVEMTMSKLEEALAPHGFIRCHNAYLVNYAYIYSIKNDSIRLKDGREVFLARRKAKEVKERYMQLMVGKQPFIM